MAQASIEVAVRWRKDVIVVDMPAEAVLRDLRAALATLTGVPEERQKFTGIKAARGGSKVADDTPLAEVDLKRATMIGTPASELPTAPELECEAVDDLTDVQPDAELPLAARSENLAKVERCLRTYDWHLFSDPRPGKKLAVFDVDYTLFDHRTPAGTVATKTRPFVHEMLAAIYPHYDIIIWSATSYRWVEMKMRELGVLGNPAYNLVAIMDSSAMTTVDAPKYGVLNTKALAVIWGKWPEAYGPHNTLMVDDLRRNFLMNPANGVRVRPCRSLPVTRGSDVELALLAEYLVSLADLGDVSAVSHRGWHDRVGRG